MTEKKYYMNLTAQGTLEEIVVNLKALLEGLQIPNMDIVIEENAGKELLFTTPVMDVEMNEIAE